MIAIQGSIEYDEEMIRLSRANRPKWQNDIIDQIKQETDQPLTLREYLERT